MVELHENGDFSDGSGWDAIVAIVNMRALDGILFASLSMLASVDAPIGAPSQLALLNVVVQLVF